MVWFEPKIFLEQRKSIDLIPLLFCFVFFQQRNFYFIEQNVWFDLAVVLFYIRICIFKPVFQK